MFSLCPSKYFYFADYTSGYLGVLSNHDNISSAGHVGDMSYALLTVIKYYLHIYIYIYIYIINKLVLLPQLLFIFSSRLKYDNFT